MSVGCSIIKNPQGGVEYVESPYNGERSLLYQEALNYTKDEQTATDLWAVASTPSFQEEVYGPKLQVYKNKIRKQLEGFSAPVEEITPMEYAGGERVYTLKENGKVVGQIRTTPYKDGHRITTSNINGQQGQGTGSKLYRAVIEHSIKNGLDLYSDTSLSPQAEGMWGKLRRYGVSSSENMVPATPFDINREPILGEVTKFLDAQQTPAELEEQELVDIKVALTGTSLNSSEELYSTLMQGFYPNGTLGPTRESLRSTGLYNSSEIDNIMSDTELQQDIDEVIQKLRATDQIIYNDLPVDQAYMATSQLGTNIIGKSITDNPYINEKEALDTLGGIKNRAEYEDTLYDSNLDYLKNREDMFPEFSSYDRAREMELDQEGNMVQRTSYTKEVLQETVKVPENNDIINNITYLESITKDIWDSSPKEIKQILKQIREDSSDIAIDLDSLEESYDDMSREEILSMLNTVADYLTNPSEANLDRLAQTLDTYSSTDTAPKERVVKVQPQSRGENLVYLNTKQKAYDLFVTNGLLPLGNNVYQAVRNSDNLDTMYNNLYLNILNNPQILPESAYSTALEQDGSLNRSVLNNPRNMESVMQDIRNHVQAQTKLIDNGAQPRNTENLERMYISAVYFNTKLENAVPTPTIESQMDSIENPVTNAQYLSTEYISDFRSAQIKAKQKNSRAYQNYYSNVRVTERGLELINSDPISMLKMQPYMDQQMKDYMSLHKYNFQQEVVPNERPVTKLVKRNYYVNYPEALPIFRGEYSTLSNRSLAAKSTEEFIKVNGKIYEAVKGTGQYTFYSQLDTNPEDYKNYTTDLSMPELDVEVSDYQYSTDQQTAPEVTAFYTQQEEQSINESIECR